MRTFFLGAVGALFVQPAFAADAYTSVYTDLVLEECDLISAEEIGESAHRRCKGYGGIPVHVMESDLRAVVSYGEKPFEEPASRQWFRRFTRLHTKLEWRLKAGADGRKEPIATILRFFLHFETAETGEKPRDHPILVVTQIKPGATCHIAYVDAAANPKANEDARAAADRLAGTFDCKAEPELVGPQSPVVFME